MSTGDIRVAEVTEATTEVVEALQRLLPVLSSSAPPITTETVRGIVESPATVLFIARDASHAIVGTLTLALFQIPTGLRAWIEDVIADPAASGQGIGELLTRKAINRAHEAGARTVDLTSAPRREAANYIYEKVGFKRRETNVWRYEL